MPAEADQVKRFTACPRCGSGEFYAAKPVGLRQELYCANCGVGYDVHVCWNGLFLIDEISPARRRPEDGGWQRITVDAPKAIGSRGMFHSRQ